ncbi:hypothetical protein EK904_007147, partial [Melospiza melodia maxima]
FQRTFESLKNVSSKSDLQKTYQKFQKDLENLDYLAYKRQQCQGVGGASLPKACGAGLLGFGFAAERSTGKASE